MTYYSTVNSQGASVSTAGCEYCRSSRGCSHCDPEGIYRNGPIVGQTGMWPRVSHENRIRQSWEVPMYPNQGADYIDGEHIRARIYD